MRNLALFIAALAVFPWPAPAQTLSLPQIAEEAAPRQEMRVFVAKKIITMERATPEATAVAVSRGRIVSVGSIDEVVASLGDVPYELDETFTTKVVMPGFIEQHLHPVLGALTLAIPVIAPEDWELPDKTWEAATSNRAYVEKLKAVEAELEDPGETLFTWGYHQYFHGDVSREALDEISAKRPIVVWHRSCHEFYLNTAALERYGVTQETIDAKGELAAGQSNLARGHFYENGATVVLPGIMPDLASPERLERGLRQMIEILHRNGVTAFNEPAALASPDMLKLYQRVLGDDDTPLYSYFIADGKTPYQKYGAEGALAETERVIAQLPTDGKVAFFPKQIKFALDGAIISQLMMMKDGYLDGHHGEWIMTPEELEATSKLYWDDGYQLHIHVNGDEGLEVVLDTLERRMRDNPRPDHRTVIVHFANSTEEQVKRIARLGAVVSANPYYVTGFTDKFGEIGLGPERADAMVRLGSVERAGVTFSLHSDLPMAPADPLYLAWAAITRTTASGRTARPDQAVTVDGALRAITIDAAQSWRREHELGSIAPGKMANLTVLEEDPYSVDPMRLKDISIWGTVFEGRLFPIE
jgi:predicted amidohydrolase YtcJ